MTTSSSKELKVFYSYAHEDQTYRQQLENHLSNLKRLYHLRTWYDREIIPGEDWKQILDDHLKTADLILLLISPDFMASDYCYHKEMQHALDRHRRGEAKVIPILIRRVHWNNAPFSHLQVLPTETKPVKSWLDLDEAYYDIILGVEKAIKDLLIARKTQEEWLAEGDALYNRNSCEKALGAYEQALRLNPNNVLTYNKKGWALWSLKYYKEALGVAEQALRLDSKNAAAYNGKGWALWGLTHFEEALVAHEQSILLDPKNSAAYNGKGWALLQLKSYEEALAAYEQALRLNPNEGNAYNGKGHVLHALNRPQEAQTAYQKARELGYS